MTLLDFLNQYWTVLFGMASFIFALGYTFFGFKRLEQDRITDKESSQNAILALKDEMMEKMTEQKRDHDEKISTLETTSASISTKVDALKDDTFKAITMIQLDIREIMTILKGKKKK